MSSGLLVQTEGQMDGQMDELTDGWMDDLLFYVLFNSISVIYG